jgi:hypothetical protein
VSPTIEEQIRAFAARNVGDGRSRQGPLDDAVTLLAAGAPRGPRKAWLLAGAVALVLVVVAGIAVWGSVDEEGSNRVATQPSVPADPALILATRAAAADVQMFTGAWPDHARSLRTTADAFGDRYVGQQCDGATTVTVVELTWDEPISLPMAGGPDGDQAGPTDVVHHVRASDPTAAGSCEYGIVQEPVVFDELGPAADVTVDDHLLVMASWHAVDLASLLKNLPTSAEAVTTTPERLLAAGIPGLDDLAWGGPSCTPEELLVIQLAYDDPPESYMGEGPSGAVNARIGFALEVDRLPLRSLASSGCQRGGSMGPTPFDLSVMGTPVPLDLGR